MEALVLFGISYSLIIRHGLKAAFGVKAVLYNHFFKDFFNPYIK
jgi:hypothetical protein